MSQFMPSGSSAAVAQALEVVAKVAPSQGKETLLGRLDCAGVAVRAMQGHRTDRRVCASGVKLLLALLKCSSKGPAALLEAEGMDAVARAMRDWPNDEGVQLQGVELVGEMLEDANGGEVAR